MRTPPGKAAFGPLGQSRPAPLRKNPGGQAAKGRLLVRSMGLFQEGEEFRKNQGAATQQPFSARVAINLFQEGAQVRRDLAPPILHMPVEEHRKVPAVTLSQLFQVGGGHGLRQTGKVPGTGPRPASQRQLDHKECHQSDTPEREQDRRCLAPHEQPPTNQTTRPDAPCSLPCTLHVEPCGHTLRLIAAPWDESGRAGTIPLWARSPRTPFAPGSPPQGRTGRSRASPRGTDDGAFAPARGASPGF